MAYSPATAYLGRANATVRAVSCRLSSSTMRWVRGVGLVIACVALLVQCAHDFDVFEPVGDGGAADTGVADGGVSDASFDSHIPGPEDCPLGVPSFNGGICCGPIPC